MNIVKHSKKAIGILIAACRLAKLSRKGEKQFLKDWLRAEAVPGLRSEAACSSEATGMPS
jgi:hypothetical protein